MSDTPRIYQKKSVDSAQTNVVALEQDEEIFTPKQALKNLRRHLMGVVDAIDKTLRHSERPKV